MAAATQSAGRAPAWCWAATAEVEVVEVEEAEGVEVAEAEVLARSRSANRTWVSGFSADQLLFTGGSWHRTPKQIRFKQAESRSSKLRLR